MLLKHHAAVRARSGDGDAIEQNLPLGRRQKAGDAIEQRGLAATRRAERHHEVIALHAQVDAVERAAGRARCGVAHRQLADVKRGHASAFVSCPTLCGRRRCSRRRCNQA